MAVLPSFYDSFTKGRRDAIDFQNLIDERNRKEALFPAELEGKYINNQYMGAIRDRMVEDNRYSQDIRPDKLAAERSGYQAGTLGNQNTIDFYNVGNRMVAGANARAATPEHAQGNELFLRSLLTNPNYYGPQQLTPPPNTSGQSAMDEWMRLYNAQNPGGPAPNPNPSPSPSTPEGSAPPPPNGGVNGIGEDIFNLGQKTAPGVVQPDAFEQVRPYLSPEDAIQRIVAAGLEPSLAQYSVELDIKNGFPLGTHAAVAKAESNFKLDAVNPNSKAAGLMQIIPGKNHSMYPGGAENFDPMNAQQNLTLGSLLLAERKKWYPDDPVKMFRAYNGNRWVDEERMLKHGGQKGLEENRAYPGRVADAYKQIMGFVGPY